MGAGDRQEGPNDPWRYNACACVRPDSPGDGGERVPRYGLWLAPLSSIPFHSTGDDIAPSQRSGVCPEAACY